LKPEIEGTSYIIAAYFTQNGVWATKIDGGLGMKLAAPPLQSVC